MSEQQPIYHQVKHDNKLPQVFQLTGASFWQMRVYPVGGGNAAVFDIVLNDNGTVEIGNLPHGYKCVISKL